MPSESTSIQNASTVSIAVNCSATSRSSLKMVIHIARPTGMNCSQQSVSHAVSQLKLAIDGLKLCHTIITANALTARYVYKLSHSKKSDANDCLFTVFRRANEIWKDKVSTLKQVGHTVRIMHVKCQ